MLVFSTLFILHRSEARALQQFASRDPRNYPRLAVVLLDPQASVAATVDGHRMLVARAGGGCPLDLASSSAWSGKGTRLIPLEDWKTYCEKASASDHIAIDTADGSIGILKDAPSSRKANEARVRGDRSFVTHTQAPSAVPTPWPQVLPREHTPTSSLDLPGQFLVDFADIPRQLTGPFLRSSLPPSINLRTSGDLGPICLRWCDERRATTWVGVIMPTRPREC
jgi:hypothetical protein